MCPKARLTSVTVAVAVASSHTRGRQSIVVGILVGRYGSRAPSTPTPAPSLGTRHASTLLHPAPPFPALPFLHPIPGYPGLTHGMRGTGGGSSLGPPGCRRVGARRVRPARGDVPGSGLAWLKIKELPALPVNHPGGGGWAGAGARGRIRPPFQSHAAAVLEDQPLGPAPFGRWGALATQVPPYNPVVMRGSVSTQLPTFHDPCGDKGQSSLSTVPYL